MSVCFHLFWNGGVMFMKYFNEGATYTILETSTLRRYADIRNQEISTTRTADVEVCSQDTDLLLGLCTLWKRVVLRMFQRYNLPSSSQQMGRSWMNIRIHIYVYISVKQAKGLHYRRVVRQKYDRGSLDPGSKNDSAGKEQQQFTPPD
jgi:hypothetical protein